MLELYKWLNGLIDPTCTCYTIHYPTQQLDKDGNVKSKDYPYCEILFPNALPNNEYSDKNQLSVSIYDNKDTDVNEIETITDTIFKALDETTYLSTTMQALIFRDTPHRLSLNDDMVGIQRRELRFVCRTYQVL